MNSLKSLERLCQKCKEHDNCEYLASGYCKDIQLLRDIYIESAQEYYDAYTGNKVPASFAEVYVVVNETTNIMTLYKSPNDAFEEMISKVKDLNQISIYASVWGKGEHGEPILVPVAKVITSKGGKSYELLQIR